MNKTIVYVIALVVVSLIAGTLLGVVLSRRKNYSGYGKTSGRFMQGEKLRHDGGPLEKLSKILNLSADQKVKLTEIMKESRQEVMRVQHKTKETFMEIKKKTDAKIREVLTPQQQTKFDKLKSNLQQRMGKERARPRSLNRGLNENKPIFDGAPEEEIPQLESVE